MKYLYIVIYILAVAAEFFLVPKFLEYSWPEKCIKSLKVKMICDTINLNYPHNVSISYLCILPSAVTKVSPSSFA